MIRWVALSSVVIMKITFTFTYLYYALSMHVTTHSHTDIRIGIMFCHVSTTLLLIVSPTCSLSVTPSLQRLCIMIFIL